jgi:hypothetical protein
MKISQLVATKTKYHESVASRLPRGIKTQKQLFNLGYRIAVEDIGLSKAKTLNENFAKNLINSYHSRMLNEGVGSFLGKMAGNVVGGAQAAGRGLKSAWNDAKAGYDAAKSGWDPQSPAGGAAAPAGGAAAPAGVAAAPAAPAPAGGAADRPYVAPAGGGSAAPFPGGETPTPPAAGTPPKTGGGGIGDIMKAIDGLDPAGKKQLAGELEKSINTPPPAAPGSAPPAPEVAPAKQPAPNFGSGQSQAPAPSKVNYSGIPKPAPLPQATPAQGAYSVKSAYAQPTPAAPAAPTAAPAAPQFKGPKVNGLQVRNMGEGKKLKFRSNFLDMDL